LMGPEFAATVQENLRRAGLPDAAGLR